MRKTQPPVANHGNRNSQQIEYWPTANLRPGPRVRKHPEAQIERIRASIRRFGFLCPPLIEPTGDIIAGVARVEAARRLGYDELPVLVASHLSAADIKAYRIADNKLAEMSTWDRDALRLEFEGIIEIDNTFDLQFTGFDTAEIDLVLNPIDASEEEGPDDEAPVPNAVAVSRVGDVWMLGEHRLVCGDALSSETFDVLMGGEAARLVLSDVPYNVPVDGHVGGLGKTQHREFVQASGEMTDAEFEDFLRKAIVVMVANLMDGGIVGLFIDWRSVETMLRVGRELGLRLLNLIVWNKSNGGMGSLYRSKHELLCLFKKGKASHVNNVMLGAKGRYRTNVWDYAGVNTFGAGRMADLEAHPTVKPVAMIADAIMDLTDRNELVIDSFVGSGTTIVAAQKTGRIARCTELDPLYVDVAIRRFKARFGIDAVHQATGLTFDALAAQRSESSAEATPPVVVPPAVRARVRPTASVEEV
ncbi:MAG: ParB N-terminal domain-containing protein [Devosia sp.]|uniref:site-specific DNA-methyltransferase n=1 Tax=Devosia sp. TaxID=1871048 RepID=UPI001AC02F1B|nr:DNA methyltransferase [Devosia sp.]MBN9308321.1 ParB N-terminal domain-containing protein [Devosia sp.]MBN9317213.1 ParB N-terminal domain-containing protein [Devosia sp.]